MNSSIGERDLRGLTVATLKSLTAPVLDFLKVQKEICSCLGLVWVCVSHENLNNRARALPRSRIARKLQL